MLYSTYIDCISRKYVNYPQCISDLTIDMPCLVNAVKMCLHVKWPTAHPRPLYNQRKPWLVCRGISAVAKRLGLPASDSACEAWTHSPCLTTHTHPHTTTTVCKHTLSVAMLQEWLCYTLPTKADKLLTYQLNSVVKLGQAAAFINSTN